MATKIGIRCIQPMPSQTMLWDRDVRGFHARRQYGNAVTFAVFYRTQDGQQRWHKIGRFGVFTPNEARREAIRILQSVALGKDPSSEREALRSALTMAQLCTEYEADMDAGRINGKKVGLRSRATNHGSLLTLFQSWRATRLHRSQRNKSKISCTHYRLEAQGASPVCSEPYSRLQ